MWDISDKEESFVLVVLKIRIDLGMLKVIVLCIYEYCNIPIFLIPPDNFQSYRYCYIVAVVSCTFRFIRISTSGSICYFIYFYVEVHPNCKG